MKWLERGVGGSPYITEGQVLETSETESNGGLCTCELRVREEGESSQSMSGGVISIKVQPKARLWAPLKKMTDFIYNEVSYKLIQKRI